MVEPVKPRRYHSPRRQEQAAATRRQILAAAQRRFERDGYAATTMAAIGTEAGVALKTVYVAFETKSGVLRALWNQLLRGDDDEIAVTHRAWYREVLDEPDPERQLRLNARNSRAAKSRVAGVLHVIRSAAGMDVEIQALSDRTDAEYHANQRAIVEAVDANGGLRRGLDVARAADILWTLNHPDLWLLLVGQRSWTPAQYEQWVGDAACAQLLEPGPPA